MTTSNHTEAWAQYCADAHAAMDAHLNAQQPLAQWLEADDCNSLYAPRTPSKICNKAHKHRLAYTEAMYAAWRKYKLSTRGA